MFSFSFPRTNKAIIIASILVILVLIALVTTIIYLVQNYRSTEFSFNFVSNMVATVIGVLISALLAIFATVAIINPYVRHLEEKRLEPMRRPILAFWERMLALRTISVLQAIDCPSDVALIISDVGMELTGDMRSLPDERKISQIQEWLIKLTIGEELSVRNVEYFQEILDELKDFIERMHTTMVALPIIFKEIPEVAIGVEILLGNFLSGIKMLEYKHEEKNKLIVTKLNFYSTAIIKNTANDAFLLVEEIRNSRLKKETKTHT